MSIAYARKNKNTVQTKRESSVSIIDSSSQNESLQRKADMANNAAQRAESPRPNNTGMPDNLKSGIESLSGFSMDDVRVHYNSSKPATVQALAYAQGTDIHVAPGQEKHLPHEAWHVAQQMAGRVSPTTNINGMPVNDNAALEHEADVMGEKAVQCKKKESQCFNECVAPSKNTMQRIILDERKKICHAKDEVYVKEGKTKKAVLSNLKLKNSFIIYFNLILNKLGRKNIDDFEIDTSSEAGWDRVYLLNKKDKKMVDIPIKAKDIAKDFDGIQKYIGYDDDLACVLQALYYAENGLMLPPPEKRKKSDDPDFADYHKQIRSEYAKKNGGSGINYQSDMGAFLLYTSMGYRNVKDEFRGVNTLADFLVLLSTADAGVKNKSYILLEDVVEGNVGHAVAVVNGFVYDKQKICTNRIRQSHYVIKNIYAKS